MKGFYVLQWEQNPGEWLSLTYWVMEESLLRDFLLHALDLHNSITCRDEIRVKRINYGDLRQAVTDNPDVGVYEYYGNHIHTSYT